MRCKHGVLGGCMSCDHEAWHDARACKVADAVAEIGRLVVELTHASGLDASTLRGMLARGLK